MKTVLQESELTLCRDCVILLAELKRVGVTIGFSPDAAGVRAVAPDSEILGCSSDQLAKPGS